MRFFLALAAIGFVSAQEPPRPAPAFGVFDPVLSLAEDGQALADSFRLAPGETVHLSYRIAGYQRSADEEKPRMKVSWKIAVSDSTGKPLVQDSSGVVDVELAPQDKQWQPKQRYQFQLPSVLETGDYRIRLTLSDEIAQKSAEHTIPFRVRGIPTAPAAFTVRNFRFVRDETETRGLANPAFRQGAAVWAKFDLAGYGFGEGNRFEVSYGIDVFRGEENIYSQPEAARETGASFYPKRQVSGAFSLQLQTDTTKGEYAIVLHAKDEIGGATHESRHVFTVE